MEAAVESRYMLRAIELSKQALTHPDCGPFGCVIVRADGIVGEGFNQVIRRHDPTAHAEIVAIRDACSRLGVHDLSDCELYASCKPCPMCLGAILWARIPVVHFGASSEDASTAGFDDSAFYRDFDPRHTAERLRMIQCLQAEAVAALREWSTLPVKASY